MKPISAISVLLTIFLLISCGSSSRIERKYDYIPVWISAIGKGYLVGEGRGASFSDAKETALQDVIAKISSAIAQSAETNATLLVENTNTNDQVFTTEAYKSQSVFKSFPMLLSGISLSKASDYYYEKLISKDTTIITYYIKYPFSEGDLDQQLEKWNTYYTKQKNDLDSVLRRPVAFQSIEGLYEEQAYLQNVPGFLQSQFSHRVNTRLTALKQYAQGIEVFSEKTGDQQIKVSMRYGGKPLQFNGQPTVSGLGLNTTSVQRLSNYWLIDYTLKSQSAARVEINFDFSDWSISRSMTIDSYTSRINLRVGSTISISASQMSYTEVSRARFFIPFRLLTNTKITVEEVRLTPTRHWKSWWSGTHKSEEMPSILIDRINQSFKGSNNFQLKFDCECGLPRYSLSTNNNITLSGHIRVRSNITNEIKVIPFHNVSLKTNW